jgi:hypothetical protein
VQYAHDEQTLARYLKAAGFADIKIFGCFTDKEADGTTDRAQFVCIKSD